MTARVPPSSGLYNSASHFLSILAINCKRRIYQERCSERGPLLVTNSFARHIIK